MNRSICLHTYKYKNDPLTCQPSPFSRVTNRVIAELRSDRRACARARDRTTDGDVTLIDPAVTGEIARNNFHVHWSLHRLGEVTGRF